MIAMSDDFKNSVSKSIRQMKGYVEITYTNSKAKDSASVTNCPQILQIGNSYLDDEAIVDDDRKGKNYASLEQDYFQLNGTFVLPNNVADKNPGIGYVSNSIFEEDTEIPITPFQISTSFEENATVNGLTLYFQNNNPLSLEIQITSGTNIENFTEEDCTISSNGMVQLTFSDRQISFLRIYVTDVLYPNRRLRLQEIDFGLSAIYENEELISFKTIEQCDRFCDNMPTNECTVELGDYNNKFDPINPKGIIKYLNNGVEVKPYIGVVTENSGVEYCSMGIYWLSDWSKSDSKVNITAKDIFSKLSGNDYSEDIVNKYSMFNYLTYKSNCWNVNINNKVTDLNDYIITKYSTDDDIVPYVETHLLSVDSKLNSLQKYGVAFGNVFVSSRNGDINYISIKGNPSNKFIKVDTLKSFENITVKNEIKNITVSEYVMTKKTNEIEEETVFENSIKSNGNQELIVQFDEPKFISDMRYTGDINIIKDNSGMWNASNQFIISSQIYLKYSYNGTSNFNIKAYKDYMSMTESLNTRELNSTGEEIKIANEFLSRSYFNNLNNSASIREHSNAIIDYRINNQTKFTSSFEFNGDPTIECGDIIQVQNKYPDENGNVKYDKVWPTKIESEFNGGFSQSVEGDIIE